MSVFKLRLYSRYAMAIASLSIMAGGVLMYLHFLNLGDGLMIFGLALLIGGSLALSHTPSEIQESETGREEDTN